jgi:F-type H+-transporting ATPase subunit delta
MGSATTQTLDRLRQRLAGDRRLATQDAALEVLECGAVVASARKLRATLADPAIATERRVALARQLFGPQVSAAVAEFLEAAAAEEWSSPVDLGQGLQTLGMLAFAAAAAAAGTRDRLLDELFAAREVFATSGELQLGLIGRRPDAAEAAALVHTLFGGQVLPETERIVAYAVRASRGSGVARVLSRFAETVASSAGRAVAHVTSARPLTAAQREQLVSRLEARQGGPVALDVRIDPALVGGVRIQLGAELIDATVSSRLEGLRYALART